LEIVKDKMSIIKLCQVVELLPSCLCTLKINLLFTHPIITLTSISNH
jgi:hypothetical protein